MNITDRLTAKRIINSLTTTGAKAPKAVTDAYDRATFLSEATRNLSAGQDALAIAVAAALEDGRDPTSDPEVHRVLTASQIANQGIMQAVDGIAFDRFRDVCRSQTDNIVTAWRKPFDQAAATLTRSHDRLGSVTLEDTAAIVAKGGDAAEAWTAATRASQLVEAIVTGWSALGDFTRLAPLSPRHRVLRLAAVDLETYNGNSLGLGAVAPWSLVVLGLALELPSFAEYHARVRDLEDSSAAADSAVRHPVDRLRSHVAGREIRVSA